MTQISRVEYLIAEKARDVATKGDEPCDEEGQSGAEGGDVDSGMDGLACHQKPAERHHQSNVSVAQAQEVDDCFLEDGAVEKKEFVEARKDDQTSRSNVRVGMEHVAKTKYQVNHCQVH